MIGSCTPFYDWIQLSAPTNMIRILIFMKISGSPCMEIWVIAMEILVRILNNHTNMKIWMRS